MKREENNARAHVYQEDGHDVWVVSIVIRCVECRGMIFLQAIHSHGDANVAYAVCPACIKAGWRLDPDYATAHPKVASLFASFLKYTSRGGAKRQRPPRATLHEHPRIDAELVRKLAQPLDTLGLSTRLSNAIRAHNKHRNGALVQVIDLVQMTEAELRKLNRVGKMALREIKNILTAMGLSLNMVLDESTDAATQALIAQTKGKM